MKAKKSARSGSGLAHGIIGVRALLGMLGVVGIMALLVLSVPGSAARLVPTAKTANPSSPTACGSLSFLQAANYGVGALPFSVAAADFNGNGVLHLGTAHHNANQGPRLVGHTIQHF